MLHNTLRDIGLALLFYCLGFSSSYGAMPYCQIVLQNCLHKLPSKATLQQKYWHYKNTLRPYNNRFQYLKPKSKALTRFGWKMPVILLINLSVLTTGNCQGDTLTTSELNNYYSLIGLINTDLKDYDLVLQKSALQDQQIRGLQAITRKQQAIGIRKEYKLDIFSSQIIQLQNQTHNLQTHLNITIRQRKLARLENWLWRGGAVFFILKTFKIL